MYSTVGAIIELSEQEHAHPCFIILLWYIFTVPRGSSKYAARFKVYLSFLLTNTTICLVRLVQWCIQTHV